MKNILKNLGRTLCALLLLTVVLSAVTPTAFAAENTAAAAVQADDATSSKAIAAAGAIAMGMAISKSADGISRQPESEGKIRTMLMLGLVFIETVVIYALIVAILIIFVL